MDLKELEEFYNSHKEKDITFSSQEDFREISMEDFINLIVLIMTKKLIS